MRGYYESAWHLIPAHYLKQFHPKYNSEYKDATEILARYNNRLKHPDYPVLYSHRGDGLQGRRLRQPERNPYYWKVDTEGQQLPYIDKLDVKLVPTGGNANELILLQSIAGNVDFQIRDYAARMFCSCAGKRRRRAITKFAYGAAATTPQPS